MLALSSLTVAAAQSVNFERDLNGVFPWKRQTGGGSPRPTAPPSPGLRPSPGPPQGSHTAPVTLKRFSSNAAILLTDIQQTFDITIRRQLYCFYNTASCYYSFGFHALLDCRRWGDRGSIPVGGTEAGEGGERRGRGLVVGASTGVLRACPSRSAITTHPVYPLTSLPPAAPTGTFEGHGPMETQEMNGSGHLVLCLQKPHCHFSLILDLTTTPRIFRSHNVTSQV
ncbi:unnamed protein product, partial [Timema podura]|nr:unnamed protein product [Timema podura]